MVVLQRIMGRSVLYLLVSVVVLLIESWRDFQESMGQFMVHVRLLGYSSGLVSSSAMRFAERHPCLRAGCLKAMRCLDSI